MSSKSSKTGAKPRRRHSYAAKRAFASQLRHHASPPEVILWGYLCRNQLGVIFRRQVIVQGFIADFAATSIRLVVEVDGRQHRATQKAVDYDRRRDAALAAAGWRTMRVPASEVFDRPHAVARAIKLVIIEMACAASAA